MEAYHPSNVRSLKHVKEIVCALVVAEGELPLGGLSSLPQLYGQTQALEPANPSDES